jgi:hypothetical protein
VARRQVRVTAGFFEQLDAHLPAERGPQGEPSVTDFIAVVLPTIIDRFAEQFDDLPELVAGVTATRMFIGPGVLVRAIAVYGVLGDDDVVDLVGIAIKS